MTNAQCPGLMHQIPLKATLHKRETLYEVGLMKLMEHEFFPQESSQKLSSRRRSKSQSVI